MKACLLPKMSDFYLKREGMKERQNDEGGGGEGGDYFKYFRPRGVIVRGRRLIEGRPLFEEIR